MHGYRLSPHRICHVPDIVYHHIVIVTLLLSIVASMLSHVHHRIVQPLGPPYICSVLSMGICI